MDVKRKEWQKIITQEKLTNQLRVDFKIHKLQYFMASK